MKNYILIVVVILFVSCIEDKKKKDVALNLVTELPYFDSADFTPRWEKPEHKIPKFSFINQNGETVTNKDYYGSIYIADFFFTTCPGICPKLEKNMSLLQEHYKNEDDIKLLSHTVMPWVDDVVKLKKYEEHNNINAQKWNLVTGDRDALYNIARNGYFADEDFVKTKDESEFIHTENFILVDKEGYIRGVYNGTIELDIKRLIRHIDILRKES
jgi:protein SCO1/2